MLVTKTVNNALKTINLLAVAEDPVDFAEAFRILTTAQLAFTYHPINRQDIDASCRKIPGKNYNAILYYLSTSETQLMQLQHLLQSLSTFPQKPTMILIGDEPLSEQLCQHFNFNHNDVSCGQISFLEREHLSQLPELLRRKCLHHHSAVCSAFFPDLDWQQLNPDLNTLISNAQTQQPSKSQSRQKLLLDCAQLLNSTLTPALVLEQLIQLIGQYFATDHIALFCQEEVGLCLVQEWPIETAAVPKIKRETLVAADYAIWSELIQLNHSSQAAVTLTAIPDELTTRPDLCLLPQTLDLSYAAVVSIPIYIRQIFYGNLTLQTHSSQGKKCLADMDMLNILANYVAVALEQQQREESIEQHTILRIQELEQENRRIQTASEAKNEFLNHMNHELRSPLTGILGFSHVLLEQVYGPLGEKQMEYIRAIADSGEHLLALINDLLDISKIEADREELYLETVVVEDICRAAMTMVQEAAREANLQLILDLAPEIDFYITDKRRLKQILVNLLSNAVKFTEIGSVTLQVRIHKNTLAFAVIDTGIGISTENQAQLFQPFSQINNHLHQKYKGTGLGLALSRKLARLFGGDLVCASQRDQGSCFTLLLPL